MTHAEFRKKQALMDEAGFLTHIRTIQVSKSKGKDIVIGNVLMKTVYRYKYRYEVILNGEIIKQTKSRKIAKEFLIDFYEAKKQLDEAQKKMNKLQTRLGKSK